MNKTKHNIFKSLLTAIVVISLFGGCKSSINKESDSVIEVSEERADNLDSSVTKSPVEIVDTLNLRIYYPHYSRIDLVCGDMPQKNDSSVIMMAAAAYTVKCLKQFSHENIIGDHVSNGKYCEGAKSHSYRGAFVFYNETPHFLHDTWTAEMKEAAKNGGCGYAQDMMIHNGEIIDHSRPDNDSVEFRALCLIDGKVAVADSNGTMRFGNFIRNLKSAGATEALYMDMGGWKYSWYRDVEGNISEIHPTPNKYATNWITFYK